MKIAVIGGFAPSLISFRGPLLRRLTALDHEVHALAPGHVPDVSPRLEAMGVDYHMFPLSRRGFNPLADLGTLLHLKQVLFRIKPDMVLSYTFKPVVYGSLAARMAWVGQEKKVFALVDGPGFAFAPGGGLKGRLLAALARPMFRAGFRSCDGICFRSARAEAFFRELGVLESGARTGVADQADPEARDRAVLAFMGMIPTD